MLNEVSDAREHSFMIGTVHLVQKNLAVCAIIDEMVSHSGEKCAI